jgi:hypothetical protein
MAISKKSAPTVIIDHFPLPGPYTGQTQLHTFLALQSVVHYYQLFESPDGSATGTVRNYFDIEPNANTFATRDPLFITAGTAAGMAAGTNFYGPDASLVGWNWYPEIKKEGSQEHGIDYVKTIAGVDTTVDDINADGFRMVADGFLWDDDQQAVIHFLPQLQASATAQASPTIASTILVTNTVNLDNTAPGNAFLIQGGPGYVQLNLPDITTVPDNEPMWFNSCGGAHINAGLVCKAGQKLQWFNNQTNWNNNLPESSIYLAQCESLAIYAFTFPDSSRRYLIFTGGEGARNVGQIIYSYSNVPMNTLFANRQSVSKASYARLWNHVSIIPGAVIPDAQKDATVTVNGITYKSNLGKYTEIDANTFRLPSLWTYGFLRAKSGAGGALSSSGVAGDFYAQMVGLHDHIMHGKGSIADSAHSSLPKWFLSILNGAFSASGSNLFGRKQDTPDPNLRTGDNENINAAGENLPSSTGVFALITY